MNTTTITSAIRPVAIDTTKGCTYNKISQSVKTPSKKETDKTLRSLYRPCKSINLVYKDKVVSGWKATIYIVMLSSGRTVKTVCFDDLTYDCYAIGLPQTGLKAQGKTRVLKLDRNKSLKAQYRADQVSVKRLEESINKFSRGMKWDEYVENVGLMTKTVKFAKSEDPEDVVKCEALRYHKVYWNDVNLSKKDSTILETLKQYFTSLEKRSAKKA